jgi:hypothetical protein
MNNRKHNKSERTAAVKAWQNVSQQAGQNHESARREVCGEFGISSEMLDKWIAEYDAAL